MPKITSKNIFVEGVVKELLEESKKTFTYDEDRSEMYNKGVMYGVTGLLAVLAVYDLESSLKLIKARQKAYSKPATDFFQAIVDIENKFIPMIEKSIEAEKSAKKSIWAKIFG